MPSKRPLAKPRRPPKPPAYPDGRCPCGEKPGCTNVGGLKRRCLAKSRRNPTGLCHGDKLMTNGRCRMHGGGSLVGPAAPGWKDGRYSKHLPPGLLERFREAAADPALTSHRAEIQLLDVRAGELLETIGANAGAGLWASLRTAVDGLKAAGSARGPDAVVAARAAMSEIDAILARGLTAATTWDELRETIELRRKLAESETRRLKDMHQMISAERAFALMTDLVDTVRMYVTDRDALSAIFDRYRRLVGRGDAPAPAA